jgi:hypothetical protein
LRCSSAIRGASPLVTTAHLASAEDNAIDALDLAIDRDQQIRLIVQAGVSTWDCVHASVSTFLQTVDAENASGQVRAQPAITEIPHP